MEPINNDSKIEPFIEINSPRKDEKIHVEEKKSLSKRINDSYIHAIRKLVNKLDKYRLYTLSQVIGVLLTEPWSALKSAFAYPFGWKKHFNFYNLNPKKLTEEQLSKRPILLIHGNHHNQSAWLKLAKTLKDSNLGPVYTVNLPSGTITLKDLDIITEKVIEIKSQYNLTSSDILKFDIIAHSRGADLMQGRYGISSRQIGTLIKIGHVAQDKIESDVHEIIGKKDVLIQKESKLAPHQVKYINTGHLGLIHSSETHAHIVKLLQA